MGAFTLRMYFNAKKQRVVIHELFVASKSQTKQKVTLFFISDIHRRKITKEIVKAVQSNSSIDLVIIGGDLAEKGVSTTIIKENVRNLATIGPLFFVWGNNDREIGEQEIRKILEHYHCEILDNKNVAIPNHSVWGICGVDDPTSLNVDIQSALRYSNKYEHLIFVSHNPAVFRELDSTVKPDLMLAGHTHGGQIRFGLFGMQEKGGFYKDDNSATLISNGFGTTLVPLRLGADPECHIVEIIYGESE